MFLSLLNEKQRRLYAGLESLKIGYGGDKKIAKWFGLDVQTVAKGRKELFNVEINEQRIRKKGGGRITLEKKRRKLLKKSGN